MTWLTQTQAPHIILCNGLRYLINVFIEIKFIHRFVMGVSTDWFVVIGFLLAPALLQKKNIIRQKVSFKTMIVVQQKLDAYSHRKVLCLKSGTQPTHNRDNVHYIKKPIYVTRCYFRGQIHTCCLSNLLRPCAVSYTKVLTRWSGPRILRCFVTFLF